MKENKYLNILYIILFIAYIVGGITFFCCLIFIILMRKYWNCNFFRCRASYLLLRKKEIYIREMILKKDYFKVLCIIFVLLIIPLLLINSISQDIIICL